MKLDDLENIEFYDNSRLNFDHDLSRLNWFNIAGKTKIFLFANSLKDLSIFLKKYKKRGKIFILGAGSNTLIRDSGINGVVIKLSSKFSDIKLLKQDTIEVGASILDRKIADFAKNNDITGMEFLSCIPGSVGGAIIMNSGCYGDEISNILISIKTIDFNGNLREFKRDQIKFDNRDDLIKQMDEDKKIAKALLEQINEL